MADGTQQVNPICTAFKSHLRKESGSLASGLAPLHPELLGSSLEAWVPLGSFTFPQQE